MVLQNNPHRYHRGDARQGGVEVVLCKGLEMRVKGICTAEWKDSPRKT